MVDYKIEFSRRLIETLTDAGHKDPRSHSGELARFTGLSRSAVSKWLRGDGMPESYRVFELADKYNVSGEWLAIGRGTKHQHLGRVADKRPTYGELDCVTDRDIRIIENVHKMSEADQSRYEEFSRIMGTEATTPTGNDE